MRWIDQVSGSGGGGTPANPSTSVQFNNSGAFGGSQRLEWDGTALVIGHASDATGVLKLVGTTSGTVSLSVADAAGTWTMKLPTSGGTNTYVLTTDGSGNTSWAAPGSTANLTVGTSTITSGANHQIVYDNSGVVGETSGLQWDDGIKLLRLDIGGSAGFVPGFGVGKNAISNGILTDITIFQSNSNPGLTFSGHTASGDNFTEGATVHAGRVSSGPTNVQLWLSAFSQLGSGSYSSFRYIVGFAVPAIGGVLNDESAVANIMIGQNGSKVGVNMNVLTAVQADIAFDLTMDTGGVFGWKSDVAMARNAAGLIEINNGTPGTLRDLTIRDVFTNDATFFIRTKTTLTNGAAANTGTLTNAPAAGNPTKWIAIDDNGVTRQIPAW